MVGPVSPVDRQNQQIRPFCWRANNGKWPLAAGLFDSFIMYPALN